MTAPQNKLAASLRGRLRAALLAAAIAPVALGSAPAAAQGSGSGFMRLSAEDTAAGRTISLGVNKSMVIDLPRAAGDVLVSNPEIADAVLRTSTRLYLIGVKLGQANVFLFDSSGAQIGSFDIAVEADLGSLNQLLAEAIPDGYARASALNGSIVLRGEVRSASDSARAEELTSGMLARSPEPLLQTAAAATGTAPASPGEAPASSGLSNTPGIINLLTITGEEQVALKVTIAEVQRSVTKQLGINVTATYGGDSFDVGDGIGGATPGGFSPLLPSAGRIGTTGDIGATFSAGGFDVRAVLRALEETDMIRTLAEPTLTAVSGEMATFLAGGEFGYTTASQGDSGLYPVVSFKQFGVQLSFTPIVLSPGRISLRVGTSVSEITGTNNGIPILSARKAETTVEQPSGGSFVIGGLLQQNAQRAVSGFPGLQRVPVLGALFSSKTFQTNETELVIIVTPYIVKPTSPKALARPGDNLAVAGDADAYFRNRLTKVYGAAAKGAGRTGFNFD